VQGLNDAGVENFQGAIDTYVSRECGQNTGDAKRDDVECARLEFDRLELPVEIIPGFAQLRDALQSCMRRWGRGKKEAQFFRQALDMVGTRTIPVLKISDFGTTGLTGTDEEGRWFALVKSQGVSEKGEGAGGSFGIGKSSPFAASRLRTVFYGTRTEDGQVALQGVSRLATHADPGGQATQGVGFIGTYDDTGGEGGDPVFRAVRSEDLIPEAFRRQEVGTDIWVIGYRSGSEWHDDLVRSIVDNFWPAIHQGIIQFRVGSQLIESANLEELILRHRGAEEFHAHHFYPAVLSQPIRANLKHVGECELYLSTATPDLPRKICMARQSGMKIYDYQPRACRVPFSGLFLCKDPGGNPLLRQMEPPRHDSWDPKRVEGDAGRMALDSIKSWIRDEVKKLNPLHSGSSFDESELAKYIPDEVPADLPAEESGDHGEDGLEPRPRPGDPPVKPIDPRVVPVDAKEPGQGGAGGQQGGDGNGGGGAGQGTGQGAGGSGEGSSSPRPSRLQVRSFHLPGNAYRLVLRSPSDHSGRVAVCALGEDGLKVLVPLKRAWIEDSSGGKSAELQISGGAIQDLRLPSGLAVHVSIALESNERLALTAVALA
jgi:hypothetical protein